MTPVPAVRPLPEIVADLAALRARRDDLHAAALVGTLSEGQSAEFALAEAELQAFERMCRRTGPMTLMAGGFRWGDELRHPQAPGITALVRLADLVEVAQETMTLSEATRRFAVETGPRGGPSIGSWSRGDLRVADAFGLEHPPAATPSETAASGNPAETGPTPDPDAPGAIEAGQNYSLF